MSGAGVPPAILRRPRPARKRKDRRTASPPWAVVWSVAFDLQRFTGVRQTSLSPVRRIGHNAPSRRLTNNATSAALPRRDGRCSRRHPPCVRRLSCARAAVRSRAVTLTPPTGAWVRRDSRRRALRLLSRRPRLPRAFTPTATRSCNQNLLQPTTAPAVPGERRVSIWITHCARSHSHWPATPVLGRQSGEWVGPVFPRRRPPASPLSGLNRAGLCERNKTACASDACASFVTPAKDTSRVFDTQTEIAGPPFPCARRWQVFPLYRALHAPQVHSARFPQNTLRN